MTHLDTSFLVDLLRERSRHAAGPATHILETLLDEELAISIHVVCELRAGAECSRARETEHGRVTALCSALRIVTPDNRFALEYGRLLGELQRRGQPIATMDLMIAAAARVENAPLVTRNVRDFERVPGLDVIAY